jgi:hypothetical protein
MQQQQCRLQWQQQHHRLSSLTLLHRLRLTRASSRHRPLPSPLRMRHSCGHRGHNSSSSSRMAATTVHHRLQHPPALPPLPSAPPPQQQPPSSRRTRQRQQQGVGTCLLALRHLRQLLLLLLNGRRQLPPPRLALLHLWHFRAAYLCPSMWALWLQPVSWIRLPFKQKSRRWVQKQSQFPYPVYVCVFVFVCVDFFFLPVCIPVLHCCRALSGLPLCHLARPLLCALSHLLSCVLCAHCTPRVLKLRPLCLEHRCIMTHTTRCTFNTTCRSCLERRQRAKRLVREMKKGASGRGSGGMNLTNLFRASALHQTTLGTHGPERDFEIGVGKFRTP